MVFLLTILELPDSFFLGVGGRLRTGGLVWPCVFAEDEVGLYDMRTVRQASNRLVVRSYGITTEWVLVYSPRYLGSFLDVIDNS